MDASLVSSVGQLGLGGIVFVIWYFDQKKIDTLQAVVKEQIEDKRTMREDRLQLLAVIEKQAALIARAVGLLDRMESRHGKAG
jgi:hypothetical protein